MKYHTDDRGRLVCDKCGQPGGVRKRTCPYKVLGDSLNGPRVELPYCAPPALCEHCYAELGGHDGIHGERCREAAAESQARCNEIERQLDAGESLSVDAGGDYEESVPTGMVGVKFTGREGDTYRLMSWADYPNKRVALSAAAVLSEPWEAHP